MDTTRRCRENGYFTPGADDSGLYRTVMPLFLLLAGALFCGQVVTAEAATSSDESATTATDQPSTGEKRPLPARAVLPGRNTPAVPEKKPVAAETGQSAPAPVEKRVEPSGSVLKKPLPSRTPESGPKASAAAGAEEVKPLSAESAAKVAVEKKPEAPSNGEKRPLPARSVATELNLPPAVKSGDKRASVPETGQAASEEKKAGGEGVAVEKRPLPVRTLGVELKTPAAGSPELKKPLEAEKQPTVPVETSVAAPSNGGKRPLPPRSGTADQGLPVTVKAEPKKTVDGEVNRAVTRGTTGDLPAEGMLRPLPTRPLPTAQKVPAIAERNKPLGAENPQSASVGPKSAVPAPLEKRPLPIRTVSSDRVNTAPAQVEPKKALAPEQRQPLPVAAKAAAPATVVKKPLPASAALHEQKTAALATGDVTKTPAVKKPLVTGQAPAAVPGQKQRSEAAGTPAGNWTIVVGSYLLENALASDQAKIKKAGLTGLVRPGDKKMTAMNRLLLAEYDDRGAAQAELDKLKRHTADAFILDHGGKHAVYAGSYLLDSRAAFEIKRLGAAGFSLTLKRVEVAIPSKSLTAGTFTDQKTAEAALNRLNAAGIKATLVRQ